MLRRYRRRILSWGAAALLVVFVLGSVITMPRVESELERRVDEAAAEAGADGVTSSFSGQDGTVRCASPLDSTVADELVVDLVALHGVHALSFDESCGENASGDDPSSPGDGSVETTPPDTGAPDTVPVDTVPADTVPAATADVTTPTDTTDDGESDSGAADDGVTDSLLDVVRNDSRFSTLAELIDDAGLGDELAEADSATLFAPVDEAFQTLGPDTIAALGRDPTLLADVLRHHVTPSVLPAEGFVSGDLDMLDGTTISISPGEAAVDAAIVSGDGEAMLIEADIAATNGVVHAIDGVLLPAGLVLSDPAVPSDSSSPAVADDAAASELEDELNALVVANPVLFEPGSATIADESLPVIAQITMLVAQFGGVDVQVEGHTDTDGNPARNQTLSENRAAAVRDALVAAGLDATTVTSVGFGGTRPIVDANGVEDKVASRRVEFVVTAA